MEVGADANSIPYIGRHVQEINIEEWFDVGWYDLNRYKDGGTAYLLEALCISHAASDSGGEMRRSYIMAFR